MNRLLLYLLAAELGQGQVIWLALAIVFALAVAGLVVWRSVVGWREVIADKHAETALAEAPRKEEEPPQEEQGDL